MRLFQHTLKGNVPSLARIKVGGCQSNRINRDMVECFKGILIRKVKLMTIRLSRGKLLMK